MTGCGVAQTVARRGAVRRAQVRFSAQLSTLMEAFYLADSNE
jgi:hypothetical protein